MIEEIVLACDNLADMYIPCVLPFTSNIRIRNDIMTLKNSKKGKSHFHKFSPFVSFGTTVYTSLNVHLHKDCSNSCQNFPDYVNNSTNKVSPDLSA